MLWIKYGMEDPSKSEVIGRCGDDEKNWMTPQNRHKSDKFFRIHLADLCQ